ncbi:Ceramide synthase 1-like [Oopsacas minuta]|uniref:Ceramide synthase 1-like n=1 Tax=Oopsacas minuta TaxID=111878 RepID=A0AAV7K6I1_9METZ|nr:Ceramide synthase 1-like [Oopsacas minuta]
MDYIVQPFVTYVTNWNEIFIMFMSVWRYQRPDSLGPSGWYQFFKQEYKVILGSCTMDMEFIIYTLAIGALITIIRIGSQKLILDKIPIWLDMNEESRDKFPESLFRLISYIFLWSCTSYVVLFSNYPILDGPDTMWSDFSGVSTIIAPDIFFVYVLQCGYYVHCAYANIALDVHRTDFWALMLHHVVTLSLISFSYASRYHNVGIIVIFLHDICDIFLEIAKCSRYLQVLGGKSYFISDIVSAIAFVLFSSSWVWLRLYWFQTKVLMGTAVASMVLDMDGEFYLVFNVLLLVLYGLNLYWFFFIVLVVYDIITGVGLSDNRETELMEKSREEVRKRKEKTH